MEIAGTFQLSDPQVGSSLKSPNGSAFPLS